MLWTLRLAGVRGTVRAAGGRPLSRRADAALTTTLYTLTIDCGSEQSELVVARLFELGLAGFEERDSDRGRRFVVYSESSAEIDRCREALRELGVEHDLASDAESDWRTAWAADLEPAAVTASTIVYPTGHAVRENERRKVIRIEPAMAFGLGSHETTRLAARSVERWCKAHPGASVLDVGCGTGVLCFVALYAGASHAVGLDIDEAAVAAARRNAEINALASRCTFDRAPVASRGGVFDLVVANIDAPTLESIAVDLARCVTAHGAVVVTGMSPEAEPDVSLGLQRARLVTRRSVVTDDWVLLELGHRLSLAP